MKKYLYVLFFFTSILEAQHHIKIFANVDADSKIIWVNQEIEYYNNSNDTLHQIVLNNWANAFSSKNSSLAKRFSDEFVRAFHLAPEKERGYSAINSIQSENHNMLKWSYFDNRIDLISITLQNPIEPLKKSKILLNYTVKIPHERFTKYGYSTSGKMYLKDWYLVPLLYVNKKFIAYPNENLDDSSNAIANYELELNIPDGYKVFSDLVITNEQALKISGSGSQRNRFILVLEPVKNVSFQNYANEFTKVSSNIKDERVSEIDKAIAIDKVTRFLHKDLGLKPLEKIVVSQEDYDKNPFYGINQLPGFINPFPDTFIYELKFIKTYLASLFYEQLQLNHRKEHWIEEGFQHFYLMKYIQYYYPDLKMLGNLSKLKILKGYNLINIPFLEQFYYVQLLMGRKNLDQPLAESKERLIKFNEQIANKYKAGLALHYLDNYLGNQIVDTSIKAFLKLNETSQSSVSDFEFVLRNNCNENLDWFFKSIIESRDLIDYKITKVTKTNDTITFVLKNKTATNVPIPVYGLSNKEIVYKKWFYPKSKDTLITISKNTIDKLVLNFEKVVPEFNLRNNWKSLNGFFNINRPLKFTFFKDLENPNFNQVFYVPTMEYNLYDGIKLGMKLNNRSFLDKPFIFDVSPEFATNTRNLVGSASIQINQNTRIGRLFNTRYSLYANTSHYAPEARFNRYVASVFFRFRDPNLRYNKTEFISLTQYFVQREKTDFVIDNTTENYNIFNARYFNIQSEMTKHYSINTDVQIANSFGKLSGEIEYRKLFENNTRINIRLFAGMFIYKDTATDFFSFGVDRPTDYLFQYNLLGRSESSGLFSQQYVIAEGGFKSKFENRFANQWLTTANMSFNIWNWIEIYGDIGLQKNKFTPTRFIYDSGIRLNLVPDYFELYFPVYSSNGFELGDANYDEKIRFTVTLSPRTLISLFTRKWF